VLHRRARIGGRGRNRQAMKVFHRQPPERIRPRSPLLCVCALLLSTLFRLPQLSHARHLW
jgi:hypothetical protein